MESAVEGRALSEKWSVLCDLCSTGKDKAKSS